MYDIQRPVADILRSHKERERVIKAYDPYKVRNHTGKLKAFMDNWTYQQQKRRLPLRPPPGMSDQTFPAVRAEKLQQLQAAQQQQHETMSTQAQTAKAIKNPMCLKEDKKLTNKYGVFEELQKTPGGVVIVWQGRRTGWLEEHLPKPHTNAWMFSRAGTLKSHG